jgi:hypothetical protein
MFLAMLFETESKAPELKAAKQRVYQQIIEATAREKVRQEQ